MSTHILTFEEKQKQHGSSIAAMARHALTAGGFERGRSMCQRWTRQVRQAVYGHKYDQYDGATAEAARKLWSTSPYAVAPERGSLIGDILYKRGTPSQPAGHVGIRIAGNRVAENSSVHFDGHDGRGTRSLEEFGKVDLIVRLPKA